VLARTLTLSASAGITKSLWWALSFLLFTFCSVFFISFLLASLVYRAYFIDAFQNVDICHYVSLYCYCYGVCDYKYDRRYIV
jgi:hypothetical protein